MQCLGSHLAAQDFEVAELRTQLALVDECANVQQLYVSKRYFLMVFRSRADCRCRVTSANRGYLDKISTCSIGSMQLCLKICLGLALSSSARPEVGTEQD